ncbi:MAG: MlaD family protein [Desulfuromonadales bacterium]|nr:MlaD family protein [Desulfuromonadales bacterium]
MAISSEQKVGLFFLSTLILLGLMIEFVEDWRPFEEQHVYHALFRSAVGLKVSDPVRIAGVDAGKVEAIAIDGHQVRVDFYVNRADLIRDDSIARIRQTNLLGGTFLGLDFGSADGRPLSPGSQVASGESANIDELITSIDRNQDRVFGSLGEMVEEAQDPLLNAINRLEQVMRKIDAGEGTLGRLINDPEFYERVTSAFARLDTVLHGLENGEGSLGRLLQDPTLYERLNQTLDDLTVLTGKVRQGEGSLGRILNDDQIYDELVATLATLREVTDRVSRGEGTLGKLYHDDRLYDSLVDAAGRINSIATKIDDGQGTLGRLVNEDDLYRDAQTALHKVEKTVEGLRDTGPLSALGVVVGTLF